MTTDDNNRDRLLELLTERALFGLDIESESELKELMASAPEFDSDELDLIAARLELASAQGKAGQLPADLALRIQNQIPEFAKENSSSAGVELPQGYRGDSSLPLSSFITWAGWVAAACLLVAFLIPRTAPVESAAELRQSLIESRAELIERDWTATEHAAADGASGTVTWSNDRQEGYMTFKGLAVNDPAKSQYQLWIFDDDQANPVDGGVFDITDSTSEVVIPIDAKIAVSKPTTFAITIEKPGGVVVSKQEEIPLVAPAPTP